MNMKRFQRSHREMLEHIADFEHYFTYAGNDLGGFVPWAHADVAALAGVEQLGSVADESGAVNKTLLALLVRIAQHASPLVRVASATSHAQADAQLALVADWLDDKVPVSAVGAAYDRSRPRPAWDDLAGDEWFVEAGQCACAAIVNATGDANAASYDGWPPHVCVGRGLVAAVRALTPPGSHVKAMYQALFAPLQAKSTTKNAAPNKTAATKKTATKKTATKKTATKTATKKKPTKKIATAR